MQSFQPYVCHETYLQMHTIYIWAWRVWSIRVINAEKECDCIKSPQSSEMFNTDYNWVLVAAPNTSTLRWRGSHPPCIGSDCLQCVRADRAAGVEYWCLSPFTARTQECVGAGEIMLSLKHRESRERVESGERTEAAGRADSRLSGTHTRAHMHTRNRSPLITLSNPSHLAHTHSTFLFFFFCLQYLLQFFKKRKKKSEKNRKGKKKEWKLHVPLEWPHKMSSAALLWLSLGEGVYLPLRSKFNIRRANAVHVP